MYSPVTWVFLEQFPVYLHFCCWFNFQLLAFPSLDFKKQISLSYCCACLQGYHRDVLEHWAPPPPPGSTTAIVHPPPPFVDQTPNKTTPEISTEVILSPPIKQILAKRGKEKKSSSKRHRKVAAGSRQISSR